MSALKHFSFAILIRSISWQIFVAMLLVLFQGPGLMAQSAPLEVEVGLQENSAPGTVVIELRERFPNLRNFRQAERSRTSSFSVDAETGRVTVRDSSYLNFERRSVLLLNLQADPEVAARDPFLDAFAESLREEGISSRKLDRMIPAVHSFAVRVLLKDAPESPRLADMQVALDEASKQGTTVAVLKAADQDHNETFVFQIVDGNEQSIFELDPEAGIVSLQAPELLDAESHPTFLLKTQVIDKDGLTAQGTVEIRINRQEIISETVATPGDTELLPETPALDAGSEGSEAGLINPIELKLEPATESARAEKQLTATSAEGSGAEKSGSADPAFGASSKSENGFVPLPPDSQLTTEIVIDSGYGVDPAVLQAETQPGSHTAANSSSSGVQDSDREEARREPSQTMPTGPQDAGALSIRTEQGGATVRRPGDSGNEGSSRTDQSADSENSVASADGGFVSLRDLCVLSVVFTVIGLTIFFLYRRAFEARREALKHKEEDDAKVRAAEALLSMEEELPTDAVPEPEMPAELPPAEYEEQAAIASNQSPESIPSLNDSGPFDPESLIDDSFFSETLDDIHRPAQTCQVLPERTLIADVDAISDMLDELGQPGVASELRRSETVERIESAFSHDITAVADSVDSSIETANPVCQAAASPHFESAEILPSRRRSVDRDELDGCGDWNDRPTLYEDSRSSHRSIENDEYPNNDRRRSPETTTCFSGTDATLATEGESIDSVQSESDAATNVPDQFREQDVKEKAQAEPAVVSTRVASLRSELADLFAIHSKQAAAQSETPEAMPSAESSATTVEEKTEERTPEESHLDSVARYLSQLLERSRKEEAEEAIFVDRRKSSGKTDGKWDGVDRRGGGQKPKPVVKSYIETYLSEHGGQLATPVSPPSTVEAETEVEASAPAVVRAPVDVQALRQHMNSFREVATVSVEHALTSYKIRQARGNMAGRTVLMIGLVVIVAIAVATNSVARHYMSSLNWMVGAIICLIVAEIFLRLQSVRRHRRELKARLLESQKTAAQGEKAQQPGRQQPVVKSG